MNRLHLVISVIKALELWKIVNYWRSKKKKKLVKGKKENEKAILGSGLYILQILLGYYKKYPEAGV